MWGKLSSETQLVQGQAKVSKQPEVKNGMSHVLCLVDKNGPCTPKDYWIGNIELYESCVST